MSKSNFDWGNSTQWYKDIINAELFDNRIYERYVSVDDGDIVVDVGASIGPFMHSLTVQPAHVYCIEPNINFMHTLEKNAASVLFPVTCNNVGIGSINGTERLAMWGETTEVECVDSKVITFDSFIKNNNLSTIDFLKTDCEGGEYEIFTPENFSWIYKNVKKISGEFHLGTSELKPKFIKFANLYLRNIVEPNRFKIYSVDGFDITQTLYSDFFLNYYREVIICINNKKY